MADETTLKGLVWVGGSYKDFCALPRAVQRHMGFALHVAQLGDKHPSAKPLQGFGGAGVLEVVGDFQGDTFRAVYTVRIAARVYVLHAFQKKSKRGRETPRTELDVIRQRLRMAEQHSQGAAE